jgi:hypothetical protein
LSTENPSGPTPAGIITFLSDGTPIGTSPIDIRGVANLTYDSFSQGTHAISAQYSGDANYPIISAASPILQTVTPRLLLRPTITGSLPKLVITGQKTVFVQTIAVTNATGSTFTGPVTANLFLSTETTIDTNAIQLPNTILKQFTRLNNSKHATFRVRVLGIATTVPPGTYNVIIALTSNAQNTQAASGGTLVVQSPKIDLAGSFLALIPSQKIGKRIRPTVVISNNGNVLTQGSLPIVIYMSPDGLLSDAVVVLSVTRSVTIRPGRPIHIHLPALLFTETPGSYFLIAIIDPNNTIGDARLANNQFSSNAISLSYTDHI